MLLESFGYLKVSSPDLSQWQRFATQLLGMQVAEKTSTTLALRLDDWQRRLVITSDRSAPQYTYGWQVADAAALDALAARLERAQVRITREPASVAAQRAVRGLISFVDPVGNRLEAFYGSDIAKDKFQPARAITGFRTGSLGLGHVVLTVERIDAVMTFYRDLLGFQLSDYTLAPFKAFFFHINRRHHSLALIETGTNGLHHLMLELVSLDDVGQAYDLAQAEPDRVSVTLGRHSNDLMTSFYAKAPSPFMIEYGWGGRNIEPNAWSPQEYIYGPSLWGHERGWLSESKRAEARALRLQAAVRGQHAPVHVLDGQFVVTS